LLGQGPNVYWMVEKPSKYFCNLENRNFTNNIIHKIEKDEKIISN